MDPNLKAVADLLGKQEPVSTGVINVMLQSFPRGLPKDYLEFIQYSDGAAGTFENGNHIILWPVGRLDERNKAYEVARYAPGIFIFGSNGGGEAFGFDSRSSMAVVQVPFIGMELSEAEYLAPTFTEFLLRLARDTDERDYG